MQELSQIILEENYYAISHLVTTVAGKYRSETEKKFLIDLDAENLHLKEKILEILPSLQPAGNKLIAEIPSKSGVHLITRPFNLQKFKRLFSEVDVHKDNPTNLYIP